MLSPEPGDLWWHSTVPQQQQQQQQQQYQQQQQQQQYQASQPYAFLSPSPSPTPQCQQTPSLPPASVSADSARPAKRHIAEISGYAANVQHFDSQDAGERQKRRRIVLPSSMAEDPQETPTAHSTAEQLVSATSRDILASSAVPVVHNMYRGVVVPDAAPATQAPADPASEHAARIQRARLLQQQQQALQQQLQYSTARRSSSSSDLMDID